MIDNDKYSNNKHLDGLPWSWFVPGLDQYNIFQTFSDKNHALDISSRSFSNVATRIKITLNQNQTKANTSISRYTTFYLPPTIVLSLYLVRNYLIKQNW